jgi:biotin operon repressor
MPWKKLVARQDRLRIYRLSLDLTRSMHDSLFGGGDHFGSTVDAIFVACCVGIGHAESRPMGAQKIAHYLGMPRTTVMRKLENLIAIGAIERSGNNYYISESRMAILDHIARAKVAIVSTAKEIMAEEEAVKARGKSKTDGKKA